MFRLPLIQHIIGNSYNCIPREEIAKHIIPACMDFATAITVRDAHWSHAMVMRQRYLRDISKTLVYGPTRFQNSIVYMHESIWQLYKPTCEEKELMMAAADVMNHIAKDEYIFIQYKIPPRFIFDEDRKKVGIENYKTFPDFGGIMVGRS
jgi:hypothetical protein